MQMQFKKKKTRNKDSFLGLPKRVMTHHFFILTCLCNKNKTQVYPEASIACLQNNVEMYGVKKRMKGLTNWPVVFYTLLLSIATGNEEDEELEME